MRPIRKPCMRATHAPPNAANVRGLGLARAALVDDIHYQDAEVLAERERLRIEADAGARRQCELRLISRGRG